MTCLLQTGIANDGCLGFWSRVSGQSAVLLNAGRWYMRSGWVPRHAGVEQDAATGAHRVRRG